MELYFELHTVSHKESEYPFSPYVYIALKKFPEDVQGKLLFSNQLMSEKEIDETFDMLITELQALKKKAKKACRGNAESEGYLQR